ncbi:MAG: hypothetical protein ACP5H1_06305 [Acidilobus sp.]
MAAAAACGAAGQANGVAGPRSRRAYGLPWSTWDILKGCAAWDSIDLN